MKYAIISDPHGNLRGLEAVLCDAREKGAEEFLLLGDYVEDFPYPNEVVELARGLENSHIVRGNKEDYFTKMDNEDQSGWQYDQMAALYWNFRELTRENLSWLMSLPETMSIPNENGRQIFLCHSSRAFLDVPEKGIMRSSKFRDFKTAPSCSHQGMLAEIQNLLTSDAQIMDKLSELPGGAYCFGHSHLQWHARIGDKLLINPGSCGLPLDLLEGAPYTILDTEPKEWTATEYRASYDIEQAIAGLKTSSLYEQTRIWSDIMISQLRRSEDFIEIFLRLAEKTAQERGESAHPCSNETWCIAGDIWRQNQP